MAEEIARAATAQQTVDAWGIETERLELPDDLVAIQEYFEERGWTDGLPVIPPTPERVEAMAAASGRPPRDVLGLVPPLLAPVTVERLAVNAVMAGCRPAYFPVVVAAMEAVLDPAFNLLGIQATTNPATPLIIVNGPVWRRIGMNAGANAMGQGNRANATIGRALRLALVNVGGAKPGLLDRATHGGPGKFTWCIAENEEESPFPPLHVSRGFAAGESVVTVVGAACFMNIADLFNREADALARTLALSMNAIGSNNIELGGGPLVVLSPEHARLLARGGFTRESLQVYLDREAAVPARLFSPAHVEKLRRSRRGRYGGLTEDMAVSIADSPEEILVITCGGPGEHTLFVPTFGDTRAVSRVVAGPA